MEREIENATRAMKNPAKPVTCVTGGSKVSDKIMLLEKFLDYADNILIGGAMAYTFLQPGVYAYVNHNLIEAAELGATAHFKVAGEWNNYLMMQVRAPGPDHRRIGRTAGRWPSAPRPISTPSKQ